MAGTLGVSLLGVHRFSEKVLDPEAQVAQASVGYEAAELVKLRGMSRAAAEPGMELGHSKRVRTRVVVEFRVGPFTPSAAG